MASNSKIHALLWSGFSLGGIISAYLLPVLLLLDIFTQPTGILGANQFTHQSMLARLANPLTKLYLIVLLSTTLFHGLYRFKAFLLELGLSSAKKPITIIIYLIAAIGILTTLYYVLTIP